MNLIKLLDITMDLQEIHGGPGVGGGCGNQQNLKCGKLQTDDPVSSKINNIKEKREREAVYITKCSAQTVFILI